MILLLICLIQLTLLLLFVFYLQFYFKLSLFFLLMYIILKYLDGDENTGFRAWSKLRSFHFFGKSVTYLYGMKPTYQSDQRILFVVMGNSTNMGLFHGFGFHGSGSFEKLDLVYMLPEVLFKIPFLRDLLLWSGAVKHDKNNILNLLNKGKSIAYAPNGMKPKLELPDVGILELAHVNKIPVVPVCILDEEKRYKIFPSYKPLQKWALNRYGWPFPYLFMYRWWNKTRPPNLRVKVGVPMDSSLYTDMEKFKEAFLGQLGIEEV